MVSFTHEQNIICSQKKVGRHCERADHYLQAVICRSRGGLSADKKEEKLVANDYYIIEQG